MTPSYPEVAGYTIDEQLLEEPGVGRVFVGRRRGSDALVALKILEAENEDLRRAFLERHEFLTKLDHPNLARTVDAGVLERGSTPWTATAYVPSLTASELLQWLGPLGEEALAVRLCLAVCQGLVHVEEHLGYNGDVRPRNIAITSTGAVLLLDLGFPSIVGGVVMPGAFDYAAPEVLAARIDVDVRADLHALGVCLFMMLTGKNPLSGGLAEVRGVSELLAANPTVSEGLALIVAGLCAAERDERYDGPRKAGQDMVRALRGEPPHGPGGRFAAVALDPLVKASNVFGNASLLTVYERVAQAKGLTQGPKAAGDAGTWQAKKPPPTAATTSKLRITRGYFDAGTAARVTSGVAPSKPADEPREEEGLEPQSRLTGKPFRTPDDVRPEPADEPEALDMFEALQLAQFEPSQPPDGPVEVDPDRVERPNFQAAWGRDGDRVHWNEIIAKRDYFFRHSGSEGGGARPSEPPVADEDPLFPTDAKARENTSGRMILSDDGSRAYQVVRELGRGGQGVVKLVRVNGDNLFEGFAEAVEEAALKTSKHPESLDREHAVYKRANPGIVKLLDSGTIKGRRGYLVLERLYLHPFNLFSTKERRAAVDMATAVDTFVNLLEILNGLHMRREMPIVLCDVKPDNIMLRMQNKGGTPTLQEYLRRIAAGAYEPVFMDMGCAQEREALRASGGRLDQLLGTPIYLPPESIPIVGTTFQPGVYSSKTDVYALTLSFYEYLTGDRPYRAAGLHRFTGREFLYQCLEMKRRRISPLDRELMFDVLGTEAKVFRRILDMGIHPDPEKRLSAISLLEECKRTFKVKQSFVKTMTDYRYDEARGLRLMQDRYPRIDPQNNRYLDFRRQASGDAATGPKSSPENLTVDDWLATLDSESRPDASDDATVHENPA